MSSMSSGMPRLPRQRRDRRAALSALALLLVVAGALGAALVVYRTGHRVDVLVAAHDIEPGTRVQSTDFDTVRVAADNAAVIDAGAEKNFIGTYAITKIPSQTLLNRLMFQAGSVLPSSGVVVGVSLNQSERPATTISTGDVVRAFLLTSNSSNDPTAQVGSVLVAAARVVATSSTSDSGGLTISLLVTADVAPTLVQAASQGKVGVGALPNTVKPAIDFQTRS